MKTNIKYISLAVAIMIAYTGCNSTTNTTENSELKSAKNLVKSLGNYRASQSSLLGDDSGFAVAEADAISNPIALDYDGNIQPGGILELVNKEGHKVRIESKENNAVAIMIDLDGDQKFDTDEIFLDTYDPVVLPPEGVNDGIVGADLKARLETMAEDESIEVNLYLKEADYIYPIALRMPNSTGGASVDGQGGVTYSYNDKEISEEEFLKIEKKYRENEKKQAIYRAKLNRERVQEFLQKHHIEINSGIQEALDEGNTHFNLTLTKQEINALKESSSTEIDAIILPAITENA